MNNNTRKTIPEPLMFIHTVSTPICSNGSRRYYDSRNKDINSSFRNNDMVNLPMTKKDDRVLDELLRQKLNNIIQMYEMSYGIPCLIETKNNESIEGIPYKIEKENLFIKQDEFNVCIVLSDIKDIIILKI